MYNVKLFIFALSRSIFTAYLHSSLGDISFFDYIVVFLVNNSGGVFRLSLYGIARLFPAVQSIFRFENFI